MTPVEAFRYVRGVSRGVRRGRVFPPAGRQVAQPAPGGTTEDRGPWRLQEVDRFAQSVHRLPVPGLAEPVTILHLTDLHLRDHNPWVERLAAVVRASNADLVVLTGDVVTKGFTTAALEAFLSALPATRWGHFAIMGNWEVWGGAPLDLWEPMLARHGVTLLHNRNVDLGPFTLVGTDDWLSGRPDLDLAFADADPTRPIVVLTHSPSLFPTLVRPGVRLVLSGHTHAGQVRIPLLGTFFLPRGSGEYCVGWFQHGGASLFVSRGIGWSVAPVRWRCLPEIATIKLEPA